MAQSQVWLLLATISAGILAAVTGIAFCTVALIETARRVRHTAAALSGVGSEITRVLQGVDPQSILELIQASRCAAHSTAAAAEQLRDALEESGKAWIEPGSDLGNSVAKLFSRLGAR